MVWSSEASLASDSSCWTGAAATGGGLGRMVETFEARWGGFAMEDCGAGADMAVRCLSLAARRGVSGGAEEDGGCP